MSKRGRRARKMYGIGIEHRPNDFGMCHGPSPDINEMLKIPGGDKAFILEFPESRKLYEWKRGRWSQCTKDKIPEVWPEDQPQNVGDYVLTFGKHRGEKLYDVPYNYLEWILTEDFDKELKIKVFTYLNRQADYHPLPHPDDDDDDLDVGVFMEDDIPF